MLWKSKIFYKMKSHNLIMVLSCVIPLLLIFLLPVFGVSSNITFVLFIVLMFGGHLLMMGKHQSHNHDTTDNQTNKTQDNEPHQH